MVRANKRLPSSVSVSKSALDSASSTLQGLPDKPKESWSLREAVSVLQESISNALGKGYSYEEIAKMLTEKKVEISASSLKSYLSAAKRQNGVSTASKGKQPGRRSKKTGGDVSMNGAASHVEPITVTASEIELPTEKPTRRKPKAASTTSTRKTAAKAKPAAKTTTKTVSKSSAASKATSSRSRKKSS